jgi:arylsulfate sulfotransferase
MKTRALPAAAMALALSVACSSDSPQAPSPQQYISGRVVAVPENVLAAAVEVKSAGYDSAYVEYLAGAGPAARTPALPIGADSMARVPVLGLDTASAYTFRVVLTRAGAADETVDSLAFTSGSLPAWIPAIGTLGTSGETGYLALSLPEGAVIVDNAGTVVWYHHAPNGTLNSFQAHPNGSYTLLGTGATETQFHVLNSLGEETGTLQCLGRPTRFHEVLVSAGGDAWVLCDETRIMDLSAQGGVAAASVTGTVVQHLSAAGALLWEWNAFDHFAITDLPAIDRTGVNVNFTHGNGLGIDNDGNLILGFRSLSEVTKVNSSTGAVMWRLGGLQNQFTFVGDPKGTFERQHGVRLAGPGQVQLLDNGLTAPSRLVRYLLNPTAHTALMEWQFIDAPTTYTLVGGSTQYHPDGHATVSFGRAGRVIEVDEAGNRVWELTGVDGMYVFRVQRIHSLYAAGAGEPTR